MDVHSSSLLVHMFLSVLDVAYGKKVGNLGLLKKVSKVISLN